MTHDFYEVEIAQRIDLFGNIAHAWSAYEARDALDDEVPERRGINSIQLFRDPELGWRIMAMIWDNEREGVSLPAFQALAPARPASRSPGEGWSGRLDSNQRPPHPQCDALPGCATPRPRARI